MGNPIFKKKEYIITQDGNKNSRYYTVVNLDNNNHTHLKTFKQAKMVLHWAMKGRVPNKYSHYMKLSILRLRPDLTINNERTNDNEEFKDKNKYRR